jgi:hypothetical protein
MTEPPDSGQPDEPADVIDDGASDVLAEDDVVHTPQAVADLAESLAHHGETFVTDVPDWDGPE